MKNKLLSQLHNLANVFGFYPKKTFHAIKGIIPFFNDLFLFKKGIKPGSNFLISGYYPNLADRYYDAGTVQQHYTHQDLYVAKKIFKAKPEKHIDVGSRIDGLITHLAVFREVEVFDIRKLNNSISNVKFVQANLMADESEFHHYTDSLSCLHAIEHFGLGRYGDPVDADGYLKGLSNITKLIKPGGKFYFSVPIGPQRVEFNAHRVFAVKYLQKFLETDFVINSFAFIDDKNRLFESVDINSGEAVNNFGCNYGCGIFELTKK
ncbi:MAG: DUF268 domain-containing protein [Ignavibacteriaceae bacterium]|nr:DUF268 domain-containing protein [Ignavibacteriaceae bacterium]